MTILDDDVPENEEFITVGLSVISNDYQDAFIIPERNQTVIAVLDNDDHGNFI